MAKRKRVTRKQLLKEPDKVITTTGRLLQMVQEYRNQLSIAAVVTLIIIGAISSIQYFVDRSEERAFWAYDKAVGKYSTVINQKSAAEALSDVREDFTEILREHSSRKAGKLARLFFANISFNGGDVDGSIELYGTAVQDFKDFQEIKSLALSGLAYAYEEKREAVKAIDTYQAILSQDGALGKDEALFNLARLYAESGNTSESTGSYEKLISDYPGSMYLEIAKDKTKKL